MEAPDADEPRLYFDCPCCDGKLAVRESLAGVEGPCCQCGELITAPQLESSNPCPAYSEPITKPSITWFRSASVLTVMGALALAAVTFASAPEPSPPSPAQTSSSSSASLSKGRAFLKDIVVPASKADPAATQTVATNPAIGSADALPAPAGTLPGALEVLPPRLELATNAGVDRQPLGAALEPAQAPAKSLVPAAGQAPQDPSPTPDDSDSASAPASRLGENGERLYSFRAQDLDIQKALSLFARANQLNIVPDPDVVGNITVDISDLPLEQIMEAFLAAHGFHWEENKRLIRVHRMRTEVFTIDYPRLVRSGNGYSSASLGGAGGGSSGGGASGGGGSGGGGGGGGSGGNGGGGTSITQADSIDFWAELDEQLKLLSSDGGTLMIDKMSGIVQVTDRPQVVEHIGEFLGKMKTRIGRQVDIEARIYEVTLNRRFELGVDWTAVIERADLGVLSNLDASTIVRNPVGGVVPGNPAIIASLMKQERNGQINATLIALKEQGDVRAVSQPRLRSLNNQMAVIKVGTEQPFFSSSSGFVAGNGGSPGGTFENTSFEMITVGTILSITPQISDDNQITLDVSPVITSLVGVESAGGNSTTTAPVLDIKQSSSLIRVRDGETIIIAGLIQDKTSKSVRGIPILGDVPLLKRVFRGQLDSKQQTELVIFLTPTIVE